MSVELLSDILTVVLFIIMLLIALVLSIHNIILDIVNLKDDEDKEEEE